MGTETDDSEDMLSSDSGLSHTPSMVLDIDGLVFSEE